MASKRGASNELNHDNWNVEEEPEEAGVFSKAPEDVLSKRVFKTAKRRITRPQEDGSTSIFNPLSLAKFGPKTSQPSSGEKFGFLSKITDTTKTNGVNKSNKDGGSDESKISSLFSFGNKKAENESQMDILKSKLIFNSKSNDQNSNHSDTSKSSEETLDNYYAKLKGLNQSVAKWINEHVESNPLINLQPIFKDYEKFFDEIEKEKTTQNLKPETTKTTQNFSFKTAGEKPATTFSFKPSPEVENKSKLPLPLPPTTFSFVIPKSSNSITTSVPTPMFSSNSSVLNSETPKFSFGNSTFSSAPLNFGITPQQSSSKPQENNDEDESEEPPKVEVKELEEEGHIYSIKCKLFVKKKENFTELGVGNLFLKPVPNSEKVQVIVRAHNSLANVLCNFILTKSHPTQKMGKNNVMVVCIPTPEFEPPPVPVLIRVKTEDDANKLLETLEQYKK